MSEAALQRRLYVVKRRLESDDDDDGGEEEADLDEASADEEAPENDTKRAAASPSSLSAAPTVSSPPLCLRLSGSSLSGGVQAVVDFVSARPAIARCDLRACGLPDEATALLLSSLLTSCRHVTDIDLGGRAGFPPNRFGSAAAASLTGLLSSPLCGLRALRLSSVGRHGLSRCFSSASVLSSSASLTALDLSSNSLGNAVVRRLCLQLSRPDCRMRRLSLAGNGLTDACSAALASLLLYSSQLVELDIGHNELSSVALTPLAAALEPDTCALSRLLLDGNALGEGGQAAEQQAEDGLSALSAALQVNHGLQLLSCRDCGLRSVSSLAAALQVNCCLSRLVLDGNRIGSAGCCQLLDSLLLNSSLQSLRLARCRLDDSLSPSLCRLVQHNPYLQALDLRDNELSDACVLPIIAVVQHHSHCAVSRLQLERNHLSGHVLQRLSDCMTRNARTQRLRLIAQYHSIVDGLRALPSHVRSCLREIEAVAADCEKERQVEREMGVRLKAQQQEAEAATASLLSQLELSREERRRQQAQHTQRLSELSASLSVERSRLKGAASSLRAEIVSEKKAQLQLQRQISRAQAVWDSLEEIRRSGDGLVQSLRQQLAQAEADRQQAQQQLRFQADRLVVAASRTVCSYWLSMQAYTTTRRFADRTVQSLPLPALSSSPLPLLCSADAGWAELEASGLLRFVPALPALGPGFDLELADFISWQFSSSTPQAAIAHVTAALHNRMPIVALAQAIAAEAEGREAVAGEEMQAEAGRLRLLVDPLSGSASAASASRRPSPPLLGLLPVPLSADSTMADSQPMLFTGCTLVLHSPPAAAASAVASAPAASSSPQLLDVPLSSSCQSLLSLVAERVGLSVSSSAALYFVPGIRLVRPLASYRSLLPVEAPSLTLEEALAELDVGLTAARAERLHGLTAAAAAGEADNAAPIIALANDEAYELPSVRSASRAQTARQRGQQEAARGASSGSPSAVDGSSDCLQQPDAPRAAARSPSQLSPSPSPPRSASGSRPSSRARLSRRLNARKESSVQAARASLSLASSTAAAAASRATSAKLRPLRMSAAALSAGQERDSFAVTASQQRVQEAQQAEAQQGDAGEQAAPAAGSEASQQPRPPPAQAGLLRRGSLPVSRSSLSRAQPVAEERILLRIRSLSVNAPPQPQPRLQPTVAVEANNAERRPTVRPTSAAVGQSFSQPLCAARALAALPAPSLLSSPLLTGGSAVLLGDSAALLPFAAAEAAAAEPALPTVQLDFIADARWWREDGCGGQRQPLSRKAAEAAAPLAAGLHWRLMLAQQQTAPIRSWPALCVAR